MKFNQNTNSFILHALRHLSTKPQHRTPFYRFVQFLPANKLLVVQVATILCNQIITSNFMASHFFDSKI